VERAVDGTQRRYDLNVFVPPEDVDSVLAALPAGVATTDADIARLRRDGQARLWWEGTPVDLFLNTTPFHQRVAERIRTEHFGGTDVPFLDCSDLAVFKAFVNRTKDWADLEEMAEASTLDLDLVVGTFTRLVGTGDERVARLISLAPTDRS